MTIVCGTDLSANAGVAARSAGAIARRLAVPLRLVHVREASEVNDTPEPLPARLLAQAEELRARFGIEVTPLVECGAADERLVALAADLDARLIVVASLGERKQHRWLLGSVAERVAQASPVPVLVVRNGDGIEAWTRGERPLRVMVGVELTPNSKTALDWACELRTIGPCEILVAQVAWPAEEHQRIGVPAPIPLDHLRPELEELLLRDLKRWAGGQPDPDDRSFLVKAGWGRVDSHLAQLAQEYEVDLLVVGTHRRAGIARLWHGSVSRGVLHTAAMSVACVPREEPVGDDTAGDRS